MSAAIFSADELRFLARMRVARLATADASNQPYVVPIVFATDGQKLYTPLDAKPKRVALNQLRRVRNLLANPQIAVVVDRYNEDWTRLAWVLITGTGEVTDGGQAHTTGIRLLQDRYPQYAEMPLEHRPLIVVTPERVTSWGALAGN